MRGAIVLAGGPSRRLGTPKALVRFGDATLVERVAATASEVTDAVVVVSRGALAARIRVAAPHLRVIRDRGRLQTPLVGLRAGACDLDAEFVAALACDLPFLRPRVLAALFARAVGADAAIPRWPNGRLEPLVAVYRRSSLQVAVEAALAARERSNQNMIARLPRVRYVSVADLRRFDPRLLSFVNVNTPADLARARRLSRSGGSPNTR